MARHFDDMTEEEAREELARHHHPRRRDPYARRQRRLWMDQFGYGLGPLYGTYGWPFLPPSYPDAAYGRYTGPTFERGPGTNPPAPHEQRDFIDRAGDEIASWFGDEAAEARREVDHRGRGPKGYVRSDARIEDDIHDRLTDDPFIDAREIAVTVKDREITLDGTVDSRRAKRHAEDCADSVSGVTHVQNNLRIQPTP